MSDVAAYPALLARVMAAPGIDRELDGDIALAFGWSLHPRFGYWIAPEGWEPVEPFEALPHFTGSQNTALALLNHVREAGYIEIGVVIGKGADSRARAKIGKREWVQTASPALAIVAAMLTAEIA